MPVSVSGDGKMWLITSVVEFQPKCHFEKHRVFFGKNIVFYQGA
jgi:hypothetical protein